MTTYTLYMPEGHVYMLKDHVSPLKKDVAEWCNLHALRWSCVWRNIMVTTNNDEDKLVFKLKFGQYIVRELEE